MARTFCWVGAPGRISCWAEAARMRCAVAALDIAVDGAGRFTFDAGLVFGPIAAGDHSIWLEAEDAAGLDATPVIYNFTLIA